MACAGCHKDLDIEYIAVSDTKKFHPACFNCTKCKTPIKGGFFSEGDGYQCSSCGTGSSDKKCWSCRKPLEGTFRVFRGRDYCPACVARAQKNEIDDRKAQYKEVIEERVEVEELNRRIAAARARGDTKKFDYYERLRWEREERQKAGYPEPERKW